MLGAAGMTRGVLVQPAVYGDDHDALIDALGGDGLIGVASLGAETRDSDLDWLHAAGVRGLRFVEARDPSGARYRGTVGFDALPALAPAMRALGWHAELWAPAERIVAEAEMLQRLQLPVVLGHLGGMAAEQGLDDPTNSALIAAVADRGFWVKLVVCRASRNWPDYADARALHAVLIAAAPERMLWGSDWPHVRMGERSPDVGHLLDLFDAWIEQDDALRHAILVRNPERLYGFAPLDEKEVA
jgi:predicted TIM-barrel fold metal-dependent hydrolase